MEYQIDLLACGNFSLQHLSLVPRASRFQLIERTFFFLVCGVRNLLLSQLEQNKWLILGRAGESKPPEAGHCPKPPSTGGGRTAAQKPKGSLLAEQRSMWEPPQLSADSPFLGSLRCESEFTRS